jgi:hypothetical protein
MSNEDLDKLEWGAKNLAPLFGLTLRQFYYKAERGLLPVDRVGATFVSTRRRRARSRAARPKR